MNRVEMLQINSSILSRASRAVLCLLACGDVSQIGKGDGFSRQVGRRRGRLYEDDHPVFAHSLELVAGGGMRLLLPGSGIPDYPFSVVGMNGDFQGPSEDLFRRIVAKDLEELAIDVEEPVSFYDGDAVVRVLDGDAVAFLGLFEPVFVPPDFVFRMLLLLCFYVRTRQSAGACGEVHR